MEPEILIEKLSGLSETKIASLTADDVVGRRDLYRQTSPYQLAWLLVIDAERPEGNWNFVQFLAHRSLAEVGASEMSAERRPEVGALSIRAVWAELVMKSETRSLLSGTAMPSSPEARIPALFRQSAERSLREIVRRRFGRDRLNRLGTRTRLSLCDKLVCRVRALSKTRFFSEATERTRWLSVCIRRIRDFAPSFVRASGCRRP